MTSTGKYLLAAATAAAVVALSALNASAAIVCAANVCWHTHERYEYPPSARVVIHDDDWKWKKHEHYRWREHEGRGYWRGSHWVEWH